ncbi:MAG: hypothetical protein ACRDRS_14685 [Pseudonocardiaceae bacterium]
MTMPQRCCPGCEARLRRGRPAGALCDPCQRRALDPRRALPPEFYDAAQVRAELGDYDFGAFFLRVRALTGWSQTTLGEIVDLSQPQISALETGRCRLRDVEIVARVATGSYIPPDRLNFLDPGTTVGLARVAGWKDVRWMERRDFVEYVAGLTLGAAGVAGLDVDRLAALLPQAQRTGTRRVGTADVEAIEQLTDTFVSQDFAGRSGLVSDAAVAQLRATLPLLGAQAAPEVVPRLRLATARLATQAGWLSFDVTQDETARRLWMIGLDIARDTGHPLGADQAAFLLYDMALQSVHLGRPNEALQLVQLGHAVMAGKHPVSAATACCLANIQATAYAAQRDAVGCDRALGQAADHFAAIDPADTEPWAALLVDEAYLVARQGRTHYTLAIPGRDPHTADRAVPLLRQAVNQYGPARARPRALYLSDLAGAHALGGDLDTAVTIGHQAVDAITALSSPRAHDKLRVLNTVLEPLHASPGVPELRDRLATAA